MSTDNESARPRLSVPPKSLSREEAAAKLYPNAKPARRSDAEIAEKLYHKTKPLTVDKIEDGVIHGRVRMPVSPPEHFKRYKLYRDKEQPLEFDGVVLGEVDESWAPGDYSPPRLAFMRAAMYRTKGGKIVTEFANFSGDQSAAHDYHSRVYKFGKAAVFDSEDVAVMWFRVGGRFTQRLLEKLGRLGSEFIE